MGVVTGVPGAEVGSMLLPVVIGPRPERLFRMRFHLMPRGWFHFEIFISARV